MVTKCYQTLMNVVLMWPNSECSLRTSTFWFRLEYLMMLLAVFLFWSLDSHNLSASVTHSWVRSDRPETLTQISTTEMNQAWHEDLRNSSQWNPELHESYPSVLVSFRDLSCESSASHVCSKSLISNPSFIDSNTISFTIKSLTSKIYIVSLTIIHVY